MSIVQTTDPSLDTPEVPDANAVTEYQRYFWIRNAHSTDTTNGDRVYTWNDNATADPTLLKWNELALKPTTGTIITDHIADGAVTDDKTGTGIDPAKINLTGYITDAHLSGITPAKIADLDGVNTGDQTLSLVGDSLTISGANGNSVTLPTATAVNLTWDDASYNVTNDSGTNADLTPLKNTVQGPTITTKKYQAFYDSNPDPNTWTQVAFSGVALVANQPYITFTGPGDYLVVGQIGVSGHDAIELTIELGLADVTSNAANATPFSEQEVIRRHTIRHDAVQLMFHLSGVSANDKYRLVFRCPEFDNTPFWSAYEFPEATGTQAYPLGNDFAFYEWTYFDSNITWLKAIKLHQ
jgi:hypothetical protein